MKAVGWGERSEPQPTRWLGSRFARRLPLRYACWVAAALFAGLALWVALHGLDAG